MSYKNLIKVTVSKILVILLLSTINSVASDNVIDIFNKYKDTINECLQRDLTLDDGKTAICFPAFGKSKADAYKNMYRYQSVLGDRISRSTTWVTTETGFTFEKKRLKNNKVQVTYIDPEWDGCAEIDGITYCEFRLVQEDINENQVAKMMSLIGASKFSREY